MDGEESFSRKAGDDNEINPNNVHDYMVPHNWYGTTNGGASFYLYDGTNRIE
jgi:hypothetical protein